MLTRNCFSLLKRNVAQKLICKNMEGITVTCRPKW